MGQPALWTGGSRETGRVVPLWTVAESLYVPSPSHVSNLEEGFVVRALITEASALAPPTALPGRDEYAPSPFSPPLQGYVAS